MNDDPIRLVTWLAPGLTLTLFAQVRTDWARHLGTPVTLTSRTKLSGPVFGSTDPFGEGKAEVGFLCAPASVPASVREAGGFELLELAPLFDDPRSGGIPTCFCDLMVREESAFEGLESLRGAVFGYNDRVSLSGWLGLASRLREEGTTPDEFFGKVVHTGGHLHSLRPSGGSNRGGFHRQQCSLHPSGRCAWIESAASVGRGLPNRWWYGFPLRRIKRVLRETLLQWFSRVGFLGFAPQSAADLERVPGIGESHGCRSLGQGLF